MKRFAWLGCFLALGGLVAWLAMPPPAIAVAPSATVTMDGHPLPEGDPAACLEAARDAGTPLHIQVLGLASIASEVTPELARAAIASVQVLGAFQASQAVKAALADRTV